MAEDAPQPIVVKRIVAGHGHHGGGWKVAFADFATAMMAFFMLMWLMGATTSKQKGGISQYFKNPSVVQGASPLPSPNSMQGPGGASTSMIQLGGSTEMYKNPAPAEGKESDDAHKQAANAGENESPEQKAMRQEIEAKQQAETLADSERLEELKNNLKIAIENTPTLKPFKDQILLEITNEGLRIQIIDKDSRSMFDIGSGTMKDYSLAVLMELAKAISQVPNRISISGHTDSKQYNRQQYGNWELSSDRANSARRALIAGGVPDGKIGRVVGLASTAPLDTKNDNNPINRRISIVVMNKHTEEAIRQESGSLFSVQNAANTTVAAPAAAAATPSTAAP